MDAKTPDFRGNLVNGRRKGDKMIIDLRQHGLGLIEVAHGGNRGNGTVQFAIRCDKSIPVHRGEVFAKIEAEKAARDMGEGEAAA